MADSSPYQPRSAEEAALLIPCAKCGEPTSAGQLVPRREGPQPWLRTRWICEDCDDAGPQAEAANDAG